MTIAIRPRSTGEILDDAWRLALADAPLLLFLNGLFWVPAALCLLVLLARPAAGPARVLLPALAALAWGLTGLGSGACQELLRRRAEGRPPAVGACLAAALRHGLEHVAAREAVTAGCLLGLGCLLMPGLALWVSCAPVHALLAAGRGRASALLGELGREARFDAGKAAAVVLSRLPLLLLLVLNGHLLVRVALWTAGNLAGFDTAWPGLVLTLDNPVYLLALALFGWLLLSPHAEAANFLLHLDTRTRQEGADLLFRVRQAFAPSSRAGVLLALAAGLLLAAPLRAGAPDAPPLSKEEIKRLLRGSAGGGAKHPGAEKARPRPERPAPHDEPEPEAPRGRPRAGAVGPAPSGGLGTFGWLLLGGLALGVLAVGVRLAWSARRESRPRGPAPAGGRQEHGEEEAVREQPPEELWRRAEEHARAGRHPEAVRSLYLAVLAVLDRRHLLRYEPTRTNGEYVRAVRLAAEAPPGLHAVFEQLTGRFETAWYGADACTAGDYTACRGLGEEARTLVGAA